MTSTASCVPNGRLTLHRLRQHALDFTIVLGIPVSRTRRRTLLERLRFPRHFLVRTVVEMNHSYCYDGVAYLVPPDYKYWVSLIEAERNTTNAP